MASVQREIRAWGKREKLCFLNVFCEWKILQLLPAYRRVSCKCPAVMSTAGSSYFFNWEHWHGEKQNSQKEQFLYKNVLI